MFNFETERLQMRPFTKEDKNEFVNICLDKDVKRYFDIGNTPDEIADFFEADCLNLCELDIIFAILYKEYMVGFISYYMMPPTDVMIEYVIRREYRRSGYAAESLEGLLQFVKKHYPEVNQGILLIEPSNTNSLKVIKKYNPEKDHNNVYTIKF